MSPLLKTYQFILPYVFAFVKHLPENRFFKRRTSGFIFYLDRWPMFIFS